MLPAQSKPRVPGSAVLGYMATVVFVALALLLALLFQPLIATAVFPLFLGAVMLSAYVGGLGAGLLATALSAIASTYFFLSPRYLIAIDDIGTLARLLIFTAVAVLISSLTTARRRAEARLQEQRERFAITLSSIGDGVITTDAQGRVTFMNPVAESLTGWTHAEAAGKEIAEVFRIINQGTRRPLESPAARALREGNVVGLANHTLLIARDGTERPIDDSGAPIRDGTGAIIGTVMVFRDITERLRAEEERDRLLARTEAARAEAEAAVQMRDLFLSVASHELKTPLTTLLGNAELLLRRAARDGTLSEREQRTTRTILEQAGRLNKMVTALLDLSRIEQGQLEVERAPLDLGLLVRRLVAELQPALRPHPIELLGPAVPLPIHGDELRLEQVLQNLIQNAAKYSPPDAPITVQVDRCRERAHVAVTDRGIGIPPEALRQVFQRFYRAPNAEEQHIGGMGIGLYVVKEIVALHGGEVEVRSTEGAGSTFTIYLPLSESPTIP